jgi:tRNA/rRNA methyltransferase
MDDAALSQIRIVLVEPAGALNVGSIARVIKNMGFKHLVLVNPQCDPDSAEARQMAVRGYEVLAAARQVATLPEALQGCQRIIATIGRDHSPDQLVESPRQALPWLLAQPAALVFGREDRGLTTTELNYAHRLVRIPAHPAYPSLNLAQAVAICCYELYQAVELSGQLPNLSSEHGDRESATELASFEALESYYQHLEIVLSKIGYLFPHTAASRMGKFRRLFSRSQLSKSELALLRGILSQFEWSLAEQKKPK